MPAAPGLHPRDAPRPTASEAERKVWRALRDGLPAGWYAWHSMLVRDPRGYLGEGDFVLAHPDRGLVVVEVKGGRLEQRDGRWFQDGRPLERSPRQQANDFRAKLVRRLAEQNAAPPAHGDLVLLPDTEFEAQPGQDDLAGCVLGAAQLPWLREALPAAVDRALPAPGAGRGAWIERLHALWGETWIPALSLGARTREAAERRFLLDEGQRWVLDALAANARALVSGGAGSGKTLLAAEAARREAAAGRRVLFLCFTQPLRSWLRERLRPAGVEVRTVSGLARGLADQEGRRPPPADPTDPAYWREILVDAAVLARPEWDTVVVDEAQDLQSEAWDLVREIARDRRLWAFHDPGQAFWPERRPPADLFAAALPLPGGRRCPPGVQALANRWIGAPADVAAVAAARAEGVLGYVACDDPAGVPAAVGKEVDRLVAGTVRLGDVGVISLRGRAAEGTVLAAKALGRHAFVGADHPEMDRRLVADSFLRWKGLERPAVIVADLPGGDLSRLAVRVHVALTRALALVRIVGPREWEGRFGG